MSIARSANYARNTQRSWAGVGAVSHHLLPSTFPFPILRVKATGCIVLWASLFRQNPAETHFVIIRLARYRAGFRGIREEQSD